MDIHVYASLYQVYLCTNVPTRPNMPSMKFSFLGLRKKAFKVLWVYQVQTTSNKTHCLSEF